MTGDAYENLASAGPGYIVALTGLQSTRTGDILGPAAINKREDEETDVSEVTTAAFVPQPVVHAALEPRSSSALETWSGRLPVCSGRIQVSR